MRVTHLPYETEIALRKDYHTALRHIEEILVAGKPNARVLAAHYLAPKVDEHAALPKTDEKGALQHYKTIRSVIEYAFEHDGRIKEKYRHLLEQIDAPPYMTALIADEHEHKTA